MLGDRSFWTRQGLFVLVILVFSVGAARRGVIIVRLKASDTADIAGELLSSTSVNLTDGAPQPLQLQPL